MQNDVLRSLDYGRVSVLVLLDLSAAFDTIEYQMLLNLFEITKSALTWISSYLHDRYQIVTVDGETSEPVLLEHGVPQGSVLGSKEYVMYTKPLEDIIKQHELDHKVYADGTQLLICFRPRDINNQTEH